MAVFLPTPHLCISVANLKDSLTSPDKRTCQCQDKCLPFKQHFFCSMLRFKINTKCQTYWKQLSLRNQLFTVNHPIINSERKLKTTRHLNKWLPTGSFKIKKHEQINRKAEASQDEMFLFQILKI